MGKRSNFKRRPMDSYDTPRPPVARLLPFLGGVKSFAEPCDGNGYLRRHLEGFGLRCKYFGDIQTGQDACLLRTRKDIGNADIICTNPPWSRPMLHPLIERLQTIAPCFFLFDSDWAFTHQAAPYLDHCEFILAVGRVRWIEGSVWTGKDNASWYKFSIKHSGGPRFIGMPMEVAA